MSVKELQNDLLKEVPECTVYGNVLVSDWTLRKLLPPEEWVQSCVSQKCRLDDIFSIFFYKFEYKFTHNMYKKNSMDSEEKLYIKNLIDL